jgi:ribosomal protein L13E
LIEDAIGVMRRAGLSAQSADFERRLGVPVELIRRSRRER